MIFLGIIDAKTPFFVSFFPSLFLARFSAEFGNFTVGTELQFDSFLLDIFIFEIIFGFIAIKVKAKSFAFKRHFSKVQTRKEKEVLLRTETFKTEKNWDKCWRSKEGWVTLSSFCSASWLLAFFGISWQKKLDISMDTTTNWTVHIATSQGDFWTLGTRPSVAKRINSVNWTTC